MEQRHTGTGKAVAFTNGTVLKTHKTYSEKLKDPKWQKLRLEILNRDDFQCRLCLDKEKELHVHHKHYVSGLEPWEYEPSILITLCKDCHTAVAELNQSLAHCTPIEPFFTMLRAFRSLSIDEQIDLSEIVNYFYLHPEAIPVFLEFTVAIHQSNERNNRPA